MTIARWFDSNTRNRVLDEHDFKRVDWGRMGPFIFLHVMCFAVIWVGWSPVAVGVAALLYFIRMFAITGAYHRYFSHRTYRTSRWFQFVLAVLGASAVQRGPLWWAAHHRKHHRHSDTDHDLHSPHTHGIWWSHVGWITTRGAFPTDFTAVPDLAKFPELRFLDRYDTLVPAVLAALTFGLGWLLSVVAPSLGTSGLQMLVWGFFVSSVVLLHGTCTINSLAHLIGRRRYDTADESRNSFILALITLGEGWHNNHHKYPGTVRQGFRFWEIDVTYYVLRAMSWCGLVWDLNMVPAAAYSQPRPMPRATSASSIPAGLPTRPKVQSPAGS